MVETALDDDSGSGPWMSPADAAAYLGMTPRALYRLVDTGELAAHRFGREIRVRRYDVFEARLRSEGGWEPRSW
jgi:excisionase family DNA binding protein